MAFADDETKNPLTLEDTVTRRRQSRNGDPKPSGRQLKELLSVLPPTLGHPTVEAANITFVIWSQKSRMENDAEVAI